MKKVLIISYYFPPCNLTASQRAFSWAKYLKKYGYKPIILTRNWEHKINSPADVSKATNNSMVFESNEDYDVYYQPYTSNLRDKILVRFGPNRFVHIRKILTLFELLLQNFFTSVIPYKNLFVFAESIVEDNPDVKLVVISGNPFNTFKIGYNLQRKFGIKWIADYRDAWTTSEITSLTNSTFLFQFINFIDQCFERKWISSASMVTASSQPIADSITKLTGVKGKALFNGFIKDDFKTSTPSKYLDFTITYVGTLYFGQKVEIICTAIKRLIDQTPDIRLKLLFPGLAYDKIQANRVAQIMAGYESYYECTLRLERHKVIEMEKKSHLLLHVAWDEQKGIIASKIYEYIASGTYTLVVPSDNGSIQEIIDNSACGICLNNIDDAASFLKTQYDNYTRGIFIENDINNSRVQQFSRENQTKNLAELLNCL